MSEAFLGGEYYNPNGRGALGYMENVMDPERALEAISDQSFNDFVTGSIALYDLAISHERPDFLIAPMRGAAPIVWTLEAIAQYRNENMPSVIAMPIGTHTDIDDSKSLGGLTKPEKQAVVESYIDVLHELTLSDHQKGSGDSLKLVLLDEARTGGTVSQAARLVRNALKKYDDWNTELAIVVAHDSDYEKEVHLGGVMGNNYGRAHKVALSMPHIDKSWLLPMILRQDPLVRQDQKFARHELLEVVDNPRAHFAYVSRVISVLNKLGLS